MIRILSIVVLIATVSACSAHTARADFIGYLNALTPLAGEQFSTDFFLIASEPLEGGTIEFLSLDVVNSDINGSAVADYTRITFSPSANFANWNDGNQFGSQPGEESKLLLDSFAPGASVFNIPDPNPGLADPDPILVGTFTFDYSGLSLQPGDTITLNIIGVPDGLGNQTTNVAAAESGAFGQVFDPNFSTASGPGFRTFAVTAVPEVGSATLTLVCVCFGTLIRQRKSSFRRLPQP